MLEWRFGESKEKRGKRSYCCFLHPPWRELRGSGGTLDGFSSCALITVAPHWGGVADYLGISTCSTPWTWPDYLTGPWVSHQEMGPMIVFISQGCSENKMLVHTRFLEEWLPPKNHFSLMMQLLQKDNKGTRNYNFNQQIGKREGVVWESMFPHLARSLATVWN